jgi:Uma2 family endonuclease
MSTTTPVTAAQLLTLHANDRCELIAGDVRMMSPAGWKPGYVVQRLTLLIAGHVEKLGLGMVFGAETGFLITRDPDTVRAPDVAFIAHENLPAKEPTEAFWPGAPDLAVEVLSPDDRRREVLDKTQMWFDSGTKQVWIVDPDSRTVTVYQSMTDSTVFRMGDELDGSDVVAGFRCKVADVFASLANF